MEILYDRFSPAINFCRFWWTDLSCSCLLFVTDGGMSPALSSAERGTPYSTASFTLLGTTQLPFAFSLRKATQNLIKLFVTGNLHCRVCVWCVCVCVCVCGVCVCVCVCVCVSTACCASQWPVCEHEYTDTFNVFVLVQDVTFVENYTIV
jgi:hypothetical protein